MPTSDKNPKNTTCPSCKTDVTPNAKFCPDCGASMSGDKPADKSASSLSPAQAAQLAQAAQSAQAAQPSGLSKLLSSPVLVVALGGALIFSAGYIVSQRNVQSNNSASNPAPSVNNNAMSQLGQIGNGAPASARSNAPAGSPQRIDLSTMTPRDAADRLFNRVMRADESGDTAQAQQFAPMAVQAYGRVRQMDADAQFHVGLIQLVRGNGKGVRQQIEILRRTAPDHLLALALEVKLARRDGDNKAADKILARYAKVYQAEIGRNREEYAAHRITVDKYRDAAKSLKPTKISNTQQAPLTATPAVLGAREFSRNCAICHGSNAAGSKNGPPLVHKIYEPSHHANDAFYRAVRSGVKSHHWSFGDMAPVPGVSDKQIGFIVAYVRKLQVQNGIR